MNREEQIKAITLKIWTWEYWAWHLIKENPVMIWDLLHFIYTSKEEILWRHFEFRRILDLWEYKRVPLEEQSDDTIEFIYNLIK